MPILATENTCTGCAACDNICSHAAIKMVENKESFLVPHIDQEKCVECGLCEKACPIVNGRDLKNPKVSKAYAFWDNEFRTSSSSGGAFSAIASTVISKGGVVYGAAWEHGFNVCHVEAIGPDDLERIRGSKYVQSDIKKTYKSVRDELRKGRTVLFTGTPCQIAGLKGFLLRPYDNLITVDIVCHGVPSGKIFISYMSKLKAEYPKYGGASEFRFRNPHGWGYAPSVRIAKSWKCLTGVPNSYMQSFDKALFFRKSCYDCHFNGLSRTGDITIADFWGIGKGAVPFKHDVSKGVSLIFINSDKGKILMEGLSGCFIMERPLSEALPLNHNILASSKLSNDRENIISDFLNPDISLSSLNKKYSLSGNDAKSRIKDFLVSTGLLWTAKSIVNKIKAL